MDEAGSVTHHFDQPCPHCPAGKRAEAKRTQERLDALFSGSQVPPRFAEARLDNTLHQNRALTAEAIKAVDERRNLILVGGYGTGKTWLAVALLRRSIEQGTPALFVEAPDLFARIRATFNNPGAKGDELVEAASTAPLLILDDLGAENPTAWVNETLFRIINARSQNELPTIVTTNLVGQPLAERVNYRVVSRLFEGAITLQFSGNDRRMTR